MVGLSLLVLLPCEAPTRRASDTFNTASAHSPSPEIAGSNDGRVVDDAADKRPCPLVFDVFIEDDNRLVHDGQPLSKRRRRASTASSVRTEQVRTSLVVNLPHGVGLYADFTRGSDYGWSRVAASAHCWRATDARRGWSTKSAFRTRCCCPGRRSTRSLCGGTTRSSWRRPLHEVVIAVAESGQLVAGAPVVSRDVDEGRPILYWP